jgi:hypothetical protein
MNFPMEQNAFGQGDCPVPAFGLFEIENTLTWKSDVRADQKVASIQARLCRKGDGSEAVLDRPGWERR